MRGRRIHLKIDIDKSSGLFTGEVGNKKGVNPIKKTK
jgi:hypothetical protein